MLVLFYKASESLRKHVCWVPWIVVTPLAPSLSFALLLSAWTHTHTPLMGPQRQLRAQKRQAPSLFCHKQRRDQHTQHANRKTIKVLMVAIDTQLYTLSLSRSLHNWLYIKFSSLGRKDSAALVINQYMEKNINIHHNMYAHNRSKWCQCLTQSCIVIVMHQKESVWQEVNSFSAENWILSITIVV